MGFSFPRSMLMVLALSTLGGLVLLPASCSNSLGFGARSARGGQDRPVKVEHEPCDTASSSAQKIDANLDGKPEVIIVMRGERMVCQSIDLNSDGRVDRFAYYDDAGQLRRVESDYDRDGRFDEIAHYQGGVIQRKDREMNLDGKLDTWVLYENGVQTKQERDSDGDGRVDEWWQFPDAKHLECAIVVKDIDGDGNPEPDTKVDTCKPPEDDITKGAVPVYGSASASGSAPPPPPPPPPPASSK